LTQKNQQKKVKAATNTARCWLAALLSFLHGDFSFCNSTVMLVAAK
jgi:hypothetical protein